MILNILTCVHLLCSLMAIGEGARILHGLFAGKLFRRCSADFLRWALAASVAGLFFPLYPLQSTHWIAMLTVYACGAAFLASCKFRFAGAWRSIYIFSIVVVFCFNILFVVTQAFTHIQAWTAAVPTLSGLAIPASVLAFLTLSVAFGVFAARRLHDRSARSS